MTGECIWYEFARQQREKEVERGQGKFGTRQYEKIGCLTNCNGYNSLCPNYYSNSKRVMENDR